jgi:hypothetical protein
MSREKMIPKPLVPGTARTPGEALERMKEFTRRLIRVPKTAIVKPKKALRKHR